MIVEFMRDYKTCHKAGSRFDAQPHFAKMLIEGGFAKAVDRPPRHKMVEKPEKEKKPFNYVLEVQNSSINIQETFKRIDKKLSKEIKNGKIGT